MHTMQVTPHLIVFDPHKRSTTVTFRNPGGAPLDADIVIQYGFTVWQNTDTALFSPHWGAEAPTMNPRDTVIAHPGPQDHDASQWISGVPTHVHLAPHESKRMLLRVEPPVHIADGEYYARLVTIANIGHRVRKGSGIDKGISYALPIHASPVPPPLRDSIRIFYRQGPQSMRLQIVRAEGAIDTTQEGNDSSYVVGVGRNPLRHLVQVHLAGTTHFEGYIRAYYLSPHGQRISLVDERAHALVAFTLHRDGILRDLDQINLLPPGHYTLVLRFIPLQHAFPPSQRVPADTAQASIPFDVPDRAG